MKLIIEMKLIIGDASGFGERLGRAFVHRDSRYAAWELAWFDTIDGVLGEVCQEPELERVLVILSKEWEEKMDMLPLEAAVRFWSEEPTANRNRIFRYQPIHSLLEEIEDKALAEGQREEGAIEREETDAGEQQAFPYEMGEPRAKQMLFTSLSGGCGVTTAALGAAAYLAAQGQRAVYLDLSIPGCYEWLTPLETRKESGYIQHNEFLGISLEAMDRNMGNILRRDAVTGVFWPDFPSGFLRENLEIGDLQVLLQCLCRKKWCDYLIIDMPFDFSELFKEVFGGSDLRIYLSDGTKKSNRKYLTGHTLLERWCGTYGKGRREFLLYNRFDENAGLLPKEIWDIPMLGGIVCKGAQGGPLQIVKEVAELEIWKRLSEDSPNG